MDNTVGLVLEGGGFRGLYSAGILHAFSENNIDFPYISAVSMGASNATNFLSKQTMRNLEIPYTFINDKRYLSYFRLFTKGELFGMDFIFNIIPYKLVPFDFKAFAEAKQTLVYVTTDCETGNPYFVSNQNIADSIKALEASTSLPFAAKMVSLHNKCLLDGGISDPIPLEKALADGCKKLVVVLTQPKGYRKQPFKAKLITRLKYRKYPALTQALFNRHNIYNGQIDLLEKLEREGKAFVLRPAHKLPISRIEKDKEKLKQAFDLGYQQGKETIESLKAFME